MPLFKMIVSFLIGFTFFLLPINYSGKTTVVFDVFIQSLKVISGPFLPYYAVGLISFGAIRAFLSLKKNQSKDPIVFAYFRMLALPLSLVYLSGYGPSFLLDPKISYLSFNLLTLTVALIVPIGAVFLNIFVGYGALEIIGALLAPIMRPVFKLPGMSALDNLTSWIGSYSLGLYLTRDMLEKGFYTRREAATIATCFSTVSIGFIGVVLSTLEISHLFLSVFITYFIAIYLLAIILVRIPPLSRIPNTYIGEPRIAFEEKKTFLELLRSGYQAAIERANSAEPIFLMVARGLKDGVNLCSSILGIILFICTLSLLLVEHTSFLQSLGSILSPLLRILGIPDPELAAPACFAGIAEMFVPVLMVKGAAVKTKFFIATLSISQLIFFSSVGPMLLSMFRSVPLGLGQILCLFILRTVILIPLLALAANIFT